MIRVTMIHRDCFYPVKNRPLDEVRTITIFCHRFFITTLLTRYMENCLYIEYFYCYSPIGTGGLVAKAPASDATGDGFDPRAATLRPIFVIYYDGRILMREQNDVITS